MSDLACDDSTVGCRNYDRLIFEDWKYRVLVGAEFSSETTLHF